MQNAQENTHLIKDIINSNEIQLIFRNQLSEDIKLNIHKSKVLTISDLSNLLLTKLKLLKPTTDGLIKFFFKGRPLKPEEKINDLCIVKKIIKLTL